jgi:hypothetical protein
LALSAAQQEPSLPQQEPPEVAQELKEKLTMAAAPMRTMTLAILFIIIDHLIHFPLVCNCKSEPILLRVETSWDTEGIRVIKVSFRGEDVSVVGKKWTDGYSTEAPDN